jgi:hypothetical protein
MFRRGLVRVVLTSIAAWCGPLLAQLGCFEVGVVGLALAGMVLAAGVVAAVPGGDRAAIRRGAAPVAVGTAAVVLQVAGVAAIAGGIVAAVVAVVAVAAGAAWLLLRLRRRRGVPGDATGLAEEGNFSHRRTGSRAPAHHGAASIPPGDRPIRPGVDGHDGRARGKAGSGHVAGDRPASRRGARRTGAAGSGRIRPLGWPKGWPAAAILRTSCGPAATSTPTPPDAPARPVEPPTPPHGGWPPSRGAGDGNSEVIQAGYRRGGWRRCSEGVPRHTLDGVGGRRWHRFLGSPTRALVLEAAAVVTGTICVPLGLAAPVSEADSPPGPRRTHGEPEAPVLLVHGLGASPRCWSAVQRALRADGRTVEAFRYSPWGVSLGELAEQLTEAAENLLAATGASRLHLVGHSLGGVLIAQALIGPRLAGRVDMVVTLGSPFGGSPWAALWPGRSVVRALRPGSPVLRDLAAATASVGIRWLAFTATFDLIVPGHRALPAASQLNAITVDGVGHSGMLVDPSVISQIVAAVAASSDTPGHGHLRAA